MYRVFTIWIFVSLLAFNAFGQEISFENGDQTLNEVTIYPNPAINEVQIEISNSTLVNPTVAIHSIIGNKLNVPLEKIKPGLYRVSLETLPSGYYLVVIKAQNFNKAYKFLKR